MVTIKDSSFTIENHIQNIMHKINHQAKNYTHCITDRNLIKKCSLKVFLSQSLNDHGIGHPHQGTCTAYALGLDLVGHMLSDAVACSLGCKVDKMK